MSFLIQQLLNGVMYGCTYSLIGIGFNLIFGVLNMINLAHGEVIMAGAFVGISLVLFLHAPLVVAFFGAMLAAALIGMLVERTCLRPLRRGHYMAPLLTTIGASIILLEVMIKLFSTEDRFFPNPFEYAQFRAWGLTVRVAYLITLLVSLALMVGLHLLISRTKLGRAIRAMAENAEAARLMGIPVDHLTSVTFGLASAIGGAAGVLIGITSSIISTTMGPELLLKGFVVIILGGLGSIPGAVIGGIVLGVVELVAVAYLPSLYRDFFSFGLLMAVLLIRPSGLLGTQVTERA